MNLLTLLKEGCKVTWPDGYYLEGDPKTGYIDIGTESGGSDGLWALSKEGLKNALADMKKMRKDDKEE